MSDVNDMLGIATKRSDESVDSSDRHVYHNDDMRFTLPQSARAWYGWYVIFSWIGTIGIGIFLGIILRSDIVVCVCSIVGVIISQIWNICVAKVVVELICVLFEQVKVTRQIRNLLERGMTQTGISYEQQEISDTQASTSEQCEEVPWVVWLFLIMFVIVIISGIFVVAVTMVK